MAMTQSARLEQETDETRVQLEQTLDELRGRLSPGQLVDQAAEYLRNSRGRAFASNLGNQVVENPLPVALIGLGIAWLAVAGTVARRSNGDGWAGVTAEGRDMTSPSRTMNRTRKTASERIDDAGEDASGAGDTLRDAASETAQEAADFYNETIERARAWEGEAASAVTGAAETVQDGVQKAQREASALYSRTAGGAGRLARKAADYGRAARHAFESDGMLLRLCREQPMLVAGVGIALGAAVGAMLPPSRAESRIMGEASRSVKARVREVAAEGLQSVAEAGTESADDQTPPSTLQADAADGKERPRSSPEGKSPGNGSRFQSPEDEETTAEQLKQ
jgi:hypothetical protein